MQRKLAELIVEVEAVQALCFDGHVVAGPAAARRPADQAQGVPARHLGGERRRRDPRRQRLHRGLAGGPALPRRPGQPDLGGARQHPVPRRPPGHRAARTPTCRSSSGCGRRRATTRWWRRASTSWRRRVERWRGLDRTVAEARLFPLAQAMADVYAAALLVEAAAWEGSDRKALVARLYARRHLADRGLLAGLDEPPEDLERFKELRRRRSSDPDDEARGVRGRGPAGRAHPRAATSTGARITHSMAEATSRSIGHRRGGWWSTASTSPTSSSATSGSPSARGCSRRPGRHGRRPGRAGGRGVVTIGVATPTAAEARAARAGRRRSSASSRPCVTSSSPSTSGSSPCAGAGCNRSSRWAYPLRGGGRWTSVAGLAYDIGRPSTRPSPGPTHAQRLVGFVDALPRGRRPRPPLRHPRTIPATSASSAACALPRGGLLAHHLPPLRPAGPHGKSAKAHLHEGVEGYLGC